MASTRFDALILGTGQAGPSLAGRLAEAGWKVAVVERGKFGGTCVNTGCIPTKTMVAHARVARVVQRAGEYGVKVPGPARVDMAAVKRRKDEISGTARQGVQKRLEDHENVTIYRGHARFEGPHTVSVNGRELLEAEHVFLNVGGRPLVPSLPGIDQVPYLTSSTMMNVDFLPEHLVVIGGSYIGLEFGQMFHRFGSKVTVIEKGPELIGREDPDVSRAIREILVAEGLEVRTSAECIRVERTASGVAVGLDCREAGRRVEGSHLLLAVGRRPNTDDLGLDRAGVATDARGYIQVDEELRTNVPGIWALGDCNGKGAFTHTSYNDGEIVGANLLDQASRKVSDRVPAYALFIDPPLGRAGMTEREVRASGKKALRATVPMENVGRAWEMGETDGFLKLLVDAESQQILGASFLGVAGDEVIHTILALMYAKAPVSVLAQAMHIHPTVSESLPVLAGSLEPLEEHEQQAAS